MIRAAGLSVTALAGIPVVAPGCDLAATIIAALATSNLDLADDDVIVVAQKIVSKAEGRAVRLDSVIPSPDAREIAARCDKDARLVELILLETDEVMRIRPGVLIVRHRLGLVLANAGIDQSNVDHAGGEVALLLPRDPDASAEQLRAGVREASGRTVGVLVIDSLGRAWRNGTVGTAIGVAGLGALADLRGRCDLHGRELRTSELGFADEIAAAASLVMGQADEATPVVLVRGLRADEPHGSARDLVRSRDLDLFR